METWKGERIETAEQIDLLILRIERRQAGNGGSFLFWKSTFPFSCWFAIDGLVLDEGGEIRRLIGGFCLCLRGIGSGAMRIEELEKECAGGGDGERSISGIGGERVVFLDAKRAAVGIGARILFYPTLGYNVLRNMIEPEFHWWDQIDEFLLLGAVPFPSDVPRLKKLGVGGVITLNEPYETLVPNSLYYAVQHFYHLRVQRIERCISSKDLSIKSPMLLITETHLHFDESSYEVVSQSDLDGYDRYIKTGVAGNTLWAELRFVCRLQIARQAAITGISYFWFKSNGTHGGGSSQMTIPVY
ncbi:hypothetical protein ZIOFF_036370 [Zingiber officinale]|uniref:Dual specificity protein phosphatase DSP8 n=1 Tax=Zingiber officinale TaxID=94328 RepID=A0A8J5G9Z3_ZINOF|nr:hypothetical protein ZIOFF_036370 [Zingiber officinale]